MITLVTRGDQALLARGVQFRSPVYSCLAGFVEPGESLEGAVVREVREEVGVEVGNIRYWGSQPWPFPHSLMVGFTADWQSGEIDIDPAEIVDAQWFRRDELPPIPPRISIARKLIDAWLDD
jgi:NAD+ diphosphatase